MAKEPIPGKPAMMTGMEEMTSQGFYIGCAKNIHFDRLELVDVEHAFHIENSQGLKLTVPKKMVSLSCFMVIFRETAANVAKVWIIS